MTNTNDIKPGDIVHLYDAGNLVRVQVTSVEDNIKNGSPGGDGITLDNPGRRAHCVRDDEPDRWFYSEQVVYVEPRS